MSRPVFSLRNVSKIYRIRKGIFARGAGFAALDSVTLDFDDGRICGLVGESGSGKSTLAALLLGMIEPSSGEILFENESLERRLGDRAGYARKVQMIFQNPYLSLDPGWTVEKIVAEGIMDQPQSERRRTVLRSLEEVGLPESYLRRRPRALSGGERQRIAIARALAVRPHYLVLDEPTSQLDVSVQAQILELLRKLRPLIPGGMLFITHDLALISGLADDLVVLERGRVVENGPAKEVLGRPRSETARRLIEAIPVWRGKDRKNPSA